MTNLEILIKVRERLSDPRNWCQREMVSKTGANCLVGAIYKILGTHHSPDHPIFTALAANIPMNCIRQGYDSIRTVANTNDWINHEQLLEWLDRTIASERAYKVDEAAKRGVADLLCAALAVEVVDIPLTAASEMEMV